eukprot:350152-Chlamydomonas_euryale.AAC.1
MAGIWSGASPVLLAKQEEDYKMAGRGARGRRLAAGGQQRLGPGQPEGGKRGAAPKPQACETKSSVGGRLEVRLHTLTWGETEGSVNQDGLSMCEVVRADGRKEGGVQRQSMGHPGLKPAYAPERHATHLP